MNKAYTFRSVLFGILGLFIWPLSPIAIHYGRKAKQDGATNYYTQIGSLMGWMGVMLLALSAICYGGLVLILNILFADMGSYY